MEKMDPHFVLSHFSVEQLSYDIIPHSQGYINDTYIVSQNGLPKYILQRMSSTVFPDVLAVIKNMERALLFLEAPDYKTLALIKTRKGFSAFQDVTGSFWRLISYIPESVAFNTIDDAKIAYEAGKILGKFHQLLQAADPDDFSDTLPGFHDLRLREEQFLSALESASKKQLENAQNGIAYAMDTLPELLQFNRQDQPLRICHNDTKLNNFLFSKKTGEALSLVDLDTIMPGYFCFDFGDAVRTIVNTASEDETDHTKIRFNPTLFEAFVEGLIVHAQYLSKSEIASLPYGVVLMPFMHGLRALTDFLDGNIHYKVSYENQNLDRAMSLFNFAQKAREHESYMESAIRKIVAF